MEREGTGHLASDGEGAGGIWLMKDWVSSCVDFPKSQQYPGFFCLLVCFLKSISEGSTFSMTIVQNTIICVRGRLFVSEADRPSIGSRGAGTSLPSVTWCTPTFTPWCFSGLRYFGQCHESWLEYECTSKKIAKKPRGMVFPRKRRWKAQDLSLNCGRPAPRATVVAVSTLPSQPLLQAHNYSVNICFGLNPSIQRGREKKGSICLCRRPVSKYHSYLELI